MTARRVLHIVGRMDRAGTETMLMSLYREIDRSRFQFDFVYFTLDRCDYDDEIESLGGHIHRIGSAHFAGRFLALYRLLRTGSWTIVHSHTLFSSGLHLMAARGASVRHRIAHSHSVRDAKGSSFFRSVYKWIATLLIGWSKTRTLACSSVAAQCLFPGRDDVILFPNAVDFEKFSGSSGSSTRELLGISAGQFVILQVGRFEPVKNHTLSIRIAGEMRDAGLDFQMLLAGKGPEMVVIQQRVSEMNLEEHVRFLGLRSDIAELMAASDVMIMPSLYEGFGLVLVEAQAAGLPSVASTEVPRAVDLGMGMVSFVGLGESNRVWANALHAAAVGKKPDKQSRWEVIERAGFSSAASARCLEQIYDTA